MGDRYVITRRITCVVSNPSAMQARSVKIVDASVAQAQVQRPNAKTLVLPVGLKCRYESQTHGGWLPCKICGVNEIDGTYNLDIRGNAPAEKIAPAAIEQDISGSSFVWP